MKYIRTEDNIWQYDRNRNVVRPSEDGKSVVYWLNFDEKEIIKQSDTIEELCDEFVFEETYSSGLKRHIITEDVAVGTQFGAIWTDKGLIYVAKMNDNGELELL